MLWLKLRNVFLATRKFRYGLKRLSSITGVSDEGFDYDSTSRASVDDSSSQSTPQSSTSPEKQRRDVVTEVDASAVAATKARLCVAEHSEGECKSTGKCKVPPASAIHDIQ